MPRPVGYKKEADPGDKIMTRIIDTFKSQRGRILRLQSIRVAQHQCNNTLTMIRSDGSLGIEYISWRVTDFRRRLRDELQSVWHGELHRQGVEALHDLFTPVLLGVICTRRN